MKWWTFKQKSSDEETMRTIHRPREACKRSYRKSLRANCLARATERKPVGGHLPYKLGFLITFLYHTTSASWPQARWNIPRRYRYPANKSVEDLLSRLWKIRRVISLCAKLLLLLLLLDAIAGKTWGKKKTNSGYFEATMTKIKLIYPKTAGWEWNNLIPSSLMQYKMTSCYIELWSQKGTKKLKVKAIQPNPPKWKSP